MALFHNMIRMSNASPTSIYHLSLKFKSPRLCFESHEEKVQTAAVQIQ